MPSFHLVSLLIWLPLFVASISQGSAQRGSPETPVSSKTWVGHYREVEEYLRTAECTLIDLRKNSPSGPSTMRCTLRPGGPVARFGWKTSPNGASRGFRERYTAEIAAYEVDKLLKLEMVPPTVERVLEGHTGAGTMWVEGAIGLQDQTVRAPDAARWQAQLARMAMFDALIGNGARNRANTLRDPVWNLILIDHSRAFGPATEPVPDLSNIDQELWARIEGLTREQLDTALGAWLDKEQISAILERRESMKAAIGRRAAMGRRP